MRDATTTSSRGLHSLGDLSPDRRFILHFPEEKLIWSVGSGYGGNALLGKKCHALRIASSQARAGGLARRAHADPRRRGSRGPDHLPRRRLPERLRQDEPRHARSRSLPGWKVWTVGDDIAWMHVDADGQLCAINPERGFFGVAPGTSPKTNPNAIAMVAHEHDLHQRRADARAASRGGKAWTPEAPRGLDRLAGPAVDAGRGPGRASELALHRARPAVPVHRAELGGPAGRADLRLHLRLAARAAWSRWSSRPSTGSTACSSGSAMGTETTAATTGKVGVVRRDPMAMLPFCGYNMADYFAHWLVDAAAARRTRPRSST